MMNMLDYILMLCLAGFVLCALTLENIEIWKQQELILANQQIIIEAYNGNQPIIENFKAREEFLNEHTTISKTQRDE